jgi:hypothetical protein
MCIVDSAIEAGNGLLHRTPRRSIPPFFVDPVAPFADAIAPANVH